MEDKGVWDVAYESGTTMTYKAGLQMGLVAWRPVQDREKKAKAQIGKATIETNEDFALDPIYLFTLPENGTVLPVPVLFRSVRLRSPETG